MDIQQYQKAYESYQQAVYLANRFPGYWNSIGLLFFAINQYHDSLDALAQSLRLNPHISEPWYNLGVLVCIRRFHKTKITD
jgi:glucose repression mediator protein